MNHLIHLAACLPFVYTYSTTETVKLSVFYESYCPYSIDFIVNQLHPVWNEFKKNIQLELVPFGNAQQWNVDGHVEFSCQHGNKECVGNILHACAIHEACIGDESISCSPKLLTKGMDYIKCLVQQPNQQKASGQCAVASMLNWWVIKYCANGRLGEHLESQYGNETVAFDNPPVYGTPFIAFNDVNTDAEQYEAQTDLRSVVCSYIPNTCTYSTDVD